MTERKRKCPKEHEEKAVLRIAESKEDYCRVQEEGGGGFAGCRNKA